MGIIDHVLAVVTKVMKKNLIIKAAVETMGIINPVVEIIPLADLKSQLHQRHQHQSTDLN